MIDQAGINDAHYTLWAKSHAGDGPVPLLQHLFDAAAVSELMWEEYLAPSVRSWIDTSAGGRGKDFFALLCGLHDVGKATPAFQSKDPKLAECVRATGLTWRSLTSREQQWHHSRASGYILRRVLLQEGWDDSVVDWVWPLLAGHHGSVPSAGRLKPPSLGNAWRGVGPWEAVQAEIVRCMVAELAPGIASNLCTIPPTRGRQLALSGLVIMADWIASDDSNFGGPVGADEVSLQLGRDRAAAGWRRLGLRGGWRSSALLEASDVFSRRFIENPQPRPSQDAAMAAAEAMRAPGLLILEAPMGEGKTESALAAAEILSRRFGADGIFVGMPTQATSDPMYSRVRRWTTLIESDVPVGLLHGKRHFNQQWSDLWLHGGRGSCSHVDEFGLDDVYAAEGEPAPSDSPSQWFLGRKRGLLTPVAVGTIDQLLYAATCTRHVMLRHAGLAGRVVILDEVHAFDVYMSCFLYEGLRWLASAGVPVILLSATLPPSQRQKLAESYLQGALNVRDGVARDLPPSDGYPSGLSVCAQGGEVYVEQRVSPPWRGSLRVRGEVLPEGQDDDPALLVREFLAEALSDGGCALVIRNTVARAQGTYQLLKELYGDEVLLVHARLTIGERGTRAERLLELLGSGEETQRPKRLVVVATQIAEQSLDIDADLLITDLAPMDLLLQRIGRLHRHTRSGTARPEKLREPRVVITGFSCSAGAAPLFPRGSEYVYGRHMLLRTAALVDRQQDKASGWLIPEDVPELVASAYADKFNYPDEWAEEAEKDRVRWEKDQNNRVAHAEPFLLSGADALEREETLSGLHERAASERRDLGDEDAVAATVRDGDPSIEVVLVRREGQRYTTLSGRSLGVQGEGVSEPTVLKEVLQSMVRLPSAKDVTKAALECLRPLPAWGNDDPWLAHSRALILDEADSTALAGRRFSYDLELGLLSSKEGG